MGSTLTTSAAPEVVREQARNLLAFAREHNHREVRSEMHIDGERVEYVVERQFVRTERVNDGHPDHGDEVVSVGEELAGETVTVKAGPKSRPRILVAIPAAWL